MPDMQNCQVARLTSGGGVGSESIASAVGFARRLIGSREWDWRNKSVNSAALRMNADC